MSSAEKSVGKRPFLLAWALACWITSLTMEFLCDVDGHAWILQRSAIKMDFALLILIVSDSEISFLAAEDPISSRVLRWTLWMFWVMPCSSILVVNPVMCWEVIFDDPGVVAPVWRLLLIDTSDSGRRISNACRAAKSSDGDGSHTDGRRERDAASTLIWWPEVYTNQVRSVEKE